MQALILAIAGGEARRVEIKDWLRGRRDIVLLGEVGDASGLRLVPRLAPDVVVLDCAAPQMNPLVALPWLLSGQPAPRVVALGAIDSSAERRLMLELGAVAYATNCEGLLRALGLAADLTRLTHGRRPALTFAS